LLALSFRPVTVDVLLPSLFLEGRPVLHARRTSTRIKTKLDPFYFLS
jgi:hypothetical protein